MSLTIDTLKHKQWFLRILVFSLVTAMIWVGVSLLRSQQKTAIPEELIKLATPLNPNIDIEVVSRVEGKKSYSPEELQNFPVYRVIRLKTGEEKVVTETPAEEKATPTPAPSAAPSSKSSPEPSTSPVTESAATNPNPDSGP